jgi:hypothetical protein
MGKEFLPELGGLYVFAGFFSASSSLASIGLTVPPWDW